MNRPSNSDNFLNEIRQKNRNLFIEKEDTSLDASNESRNINVSNMQSGDNLLDREKISPINIGDINQLKSGKNNFEIKFSSEDTSDLEFRKRNLEGEMEIFLYNSFPYGAMSAMTSIASTVSAFASSPQAAINSSVNASFTIFSAIHKSRYFSPGEFAQLFLSNFYTNMVFRGITIKKGESVKGGVAEIADSFPNIQYENKTLLHRFLNTISGLFKKQPTSNGSSVLRELKDKNNVSYSITENRIDINIKEDKENISENIAFPDFTFNPTFAQFNLLNGVMENEGRSVFTSNQFRQNPREINLRNRARYSEVSGDYDKDVSFSSDGESTKLSSKFQGKDSDDLSNRDYFSEVEFDTSFDVSYASFETGENGVMKTSSVSTTFSSDQGEEPTIQNLSIQDFFIVEVLKLEDINISYLNLEGDLVEEDVKSAVSKKNREEDVIGQIQVIPIVGNEFSNVLQRFNIPFQFNPDLQEGNIQAQYEGTQILSRIGELQSYSNTGNMSLSLSTNYLAIGLEGQQTMPGFETDGIGSGFFTLERIQAIELAYRSLILPHYPDFDEDKGYRYIKPPIIRVVIGDIEEAGPYANLVSYQSNDLIGDKFQASGERFGERIYKSFVVSSVEIKKDINSQEMPLYINKKGKLTDTFGYEVSLSLIEVAPSYMDRLPDYRNYYEAYKNIIGV